MTAPAYSPGQRREALTLAKKLGSGRKAAKQLGIHYQTLQRWEAAARKASTASSWRCPCNPEQTQTGGRCRRCYNLRPSH